VSSVRRLAEDYLGRELEVESRAGVEHLKPGQHRARWLEETLDESTPLLAELSYCAGDGHTVVLVILDGDTLEPYGLTVRMSGAGLRYMETPEDFELSDAMRAAITELRPG
jgi:hypothetical protein